MRKKALGVTLTLAVLVGTSGCYGGFALTKKLHTWIGGLGSKPVVEIAYLGCMILPVYGITGFVDFVILNTAEFWSGKNPMASATKSLTDGEKQVVMKLDRETGSAKLYVFARGSLVGSAVIERGADGRTVARTSDGRRLAAMTGSDGSVTVTDTAGVTRTFCDETAFATAN